MNITGAMPAVEMLIEKLEEEIQLLHERVDAKLWSRYTRTSFVYNLTHTIHSLEEIAALIEQIMIEFRNEGLNGYPDAKQHTKELNELIVVLKRNQRMEEETVEKQGASVSGLRDGAGASEQYAALEQKVLSVLLKSRYFAERINMFMKKTRSTPAHTYGKTRNILELLEQKENELQKLRGRYEEIKNRSLVGMIGEESAADIEKELNELSAKLSAEDSLLEEGVSSFRKQLEQLGVRQAELSGKTRNIREMQARHSEKTAELVAMLKKERDYAKKIVLDIEHETLQLRNTYSNELLNLEEEKIRAKNDAYEKFKERVGRQDAELNEKKELIRHLREAVEAREHRIRALEMKNAGAKNAPEKGYGKKKKKHPEAK